jgi:hypothetical protein
MKKYIKVLIILIIIFIILFVYKTNKKYNKIPIVEESVKTEDIKIEENTKMPGVGSLSGWKVTQRQDSQSFYKEIWKAVPKEKGYQFILDSGSIIVWGEKDDLCKTEKEFIYGVSDSACVNFLYAFIKTDNPSKSLSSQDLKDFGDFVLKNK